LIVWGNTRAQAIARLPRALDEYQIVGVRTTIPFARWLMDHPRYIAGDMSTDFIAEEWDTRPKDNVPEKTTQEMAPAQVAAIAASLLMQSHVENEQQRRQPVSDGQGESNKWRDAGRREVLRRS